MTSDTSFGPDQMEEGVHAWTSPCNPDPLKPGVKLMAGCNSAGVGVTSVSLPVVNSYVSKTCDKGVKGRMLLCRVELCVTEMSASRQILMIYIKTNLNFLRSYCATINLVSYIDFLTATQSWTNAMQVQFA